MSLDTGDRRDLRLVALIAALGRCRMFAGLSQEDLAAVAEGCSTRPLGKGQHLFREGEPAEGFFVMQTGRVSVYRVAPDGREQIVWVFSPPDSFAEVALGALAAYPADAVALEPSQAVLVGKAHFRELIRRKPEFALRMLASMSQHLHHLVQTLQDARGRPIEAKLAERLLKLSPAAAAGCPAVFSLPVAKKILAGELGVSSETLSRAFARFRREEVIRVAGPRITVLDAGRLRACAEGTD